MTDILKIILGMLLVTQMKTAKLAAEGRMLETIAIPD
jgi:hypothetical protein